MFTFGSLSAALIWVVPVVWPGFLWKLLLKKTDDGLNHHTLRHDRVRPGPEPVQARPGQLQASGRFPHVGLWPADPLTMSDPGGPPIAASSEEPPAPGGPARPPLAEKALSEAYARLRYQDASLLIWQQQQAALQVASPSTYLSRSQSAWYSSYGNQAVLVRDRRTLGDTDGGSRICSIM